MKKVKLYTGSLILICISMIAGCSDNLINPESTGPVSLKTPDASMNLEEGFYNLKFTLHPGESRTFHYGNTGLILIHSYSISNCNIHTRDLLIRSSMQADSSSLPCTWKKFGYFAFEDLTIKNVSSQLKLISVNLRGYTING